MKNELFACKGTDRFLAKKWGMGRIADEVIEISIGLIAQTRLKWGLGRSFDSRWS